MRYAIYFTPRQDEPLARIAANWLGRDPFGAATRPVEAVGELSAAEVAFHTASARRYGFHATLTEAEIERRSPDSLKPAEFRNLCQWGYPYVFETFRFHMTLSGRAGTQESPRLRAAIDGLFAQVLQQPVPVDALTLFVETEPGAPFMVLSHHALGRRAARKTA